MSTPARKPGHELALWMLEQQMSVKALAYDLKCSRVWLSKIRSGARIPSLELAVRLDKLTQGRVPVAAWVVT